MSDTNFRASDPGLDKTREDFVSEAQELVDALGRELVALDTAARAGLPAPDAVHDAFRSVHTLKGLSSLFGASKMSVLSHELEDILDELRFGRVLATPAVLDVLFEAVDVLGRLLGMEKGKGAEPTYELEALLTAISDLARGRGGGGPIAQFDLDPGLLAVLTEYEEHRLRVNVQAGTALFRARVRLSLGEIDTALDSLRERLRAHAEILTYLPTGSGTDIETIELEILLASRSPFDDLRLVLGEDVELEAVRRRSPKSLPVTTARSSAPPSGEPPRVSPPSDAPAHSQSDPAPPASLAEWGRDPSPSRSFGNSIAQPALAPAAELTLRSVSQSVRVDIRKLDHLMTLVGELAIVRTGLSRLVEKLRSHKETRSMAHEVVRLHRSFDRNLSQMQNGILEVRMVPLGQVFDKLARVVRQLCRELDKEVSFVVSGAETETDKLIVEELSDPLMHMIRNAIDHGIESRDERGMVGKPPLGTIALNAFQKGNHVVIEVEDDGRGMDVERIIKRAIDRRLLTPEEATDLSTHEALSLVFVPGFTTRDAASDLSGRGVGLDVVKTNIARLGGVVDIETELGIGSKLTLTLPTTLAIISVLLVEVAGQLFAAPIAALQEALSLDITLVRMLDGREVLTLRDSTLVLCRLGPLFGLSDEERTKKGYVIVAKVGSRRIGFVVDRVIEQQDIVVKTLGRAIRSTRGISGATELGDQRVALVLDLPALMEEVGMGADSRGATGLLVGGRPQ